MSNKKDFLIIGSIICVIATLVLLDRVAIPCIFQKITGLYCPGCGITRAIISLLKGQLYQAFRYNSIIFVDIPILIVLKCLELLFKNSKAIKIVTNVVVVILLIITVLYGVMRNIPSFSYLAPTIIT